MRHIDDGKNKCGAQRFVLLGLAACCHGYNIRFRGCVCVCTGKTLGGMFRWLKRGSVFSFLS